MKMQAVIGGGIGGASASHYLTKLFHNDLHIDLYEANNIGGRLATIEIDKRMYEAGGAIIHRKNKYMQDFVELLGMQHRSGNDKKFGIWDGKEFVFEESSYGAITFTKLLIRYGLQPLSLYKYVNSVLEDFSNIYNLQDDGVYFTNVADLLKAMNPEFPNLLNISIKDHLSNMGYAERIIDELVRATLLVNYGQSTDVHSFVGLVSLAGAGTGLWAVKGGNKMVPENLIYRNKNLTIISSRVNKIRYLAHDDQYEIHYKSEGNDDMKNVYDMVILATPLTEDQETQIIFENFGEEEPTFSGEYQTTVATFVEGNLNLSTFGLTGTLDGVLSCNPLTVVNSIGHIDSVEGFFNNHPQVWKIFSKRPLSLEEMNYVVSEVDEVKEIIWRAYPKYSTNTRSDKFKLHHALYHVNAIEWAASAMEMSAIAGRNVAILAHYEFFKKCYFLLDDSEMTKTRNFVHSTEL